MGEGLTWLVFEALLLTNHYTFSVVPTRDIVNMPCQLFRPPRRNRFPCHYGIYGPNGTIARQFVSTNLIGCPAPTPSPTRHMFYVQGPEEFRYRYRRSR